MTDQFIMLSKAIKSIKNEMKRQKCWKEANEDVIERLHWVLDNIDRVGVSFSNTFTMLFKWELERRKLEGETISDPLVEQISAMMDMIISEETYQAGKLPTRSVLNLYDYIEPNDADVQFCLFVCMKIQALEKLGVIGTRVASPLSSVSKNKPKNKTFKWNFDEESSENLDVN